MRKIIPIILLSFVACKTPAPIIYYSIASAPHEIETIKTTLIPIPFDRNDEIHIFAGLDVTKDSSITYVLFVPNDHFGNLMMGEATSLPASEAHELLTIVDAIDNAMANNSSESFIRFVSSAKIYVQPKKDAFDNAGNWAVEFNSIAEKAWVPCVTLAYVNFGEEKSCKFYLQREGWSDMFLFKGQADLIGFKTKVSNALHQCDLLISK